MTAAPNAPSRSLDEYGPSNGRFTYPVRFPKWFQIVADGFQSLFRRLKGPAVVNWLLTILGGLRTVGIYLVRPLQRSDGPNKFRLSAMETATTTHDGDQGWAKRPPAMLECDRCGSEVLQHNARDSIDCPRCVAEFDYDEFADLELLYLTCPVCKSRMSHGQRHPERLDVVEWATCDACRYHWEFKHSYS